MQLTYSEFLVKNHNFSHSSVCNMTGFGLSLHFLAFSIVPFNSLVFIAFVLCHFSLVQGSPSMVNSWSLFKNLPLGRGLASEEVSSGVVSVSMYQYIQGKSSNCSK